MLQALQRLAGSQQVAEVLLNQPGCIGRIFSSYMCGNDHVVLEAARLLTRLWAPSAARVGAGGWGQQQWPGWGQVGGAPTEARVGAGGWGQQQRSGWGQVGVGGRVCRAGQGRALPLAPPNRTGTLPWPGQPSPAQPCLPMPIHAGGKDRQVQAGRFQAGRFRHIETRVACSRHIETCATPW